MSPGKDDARRGIGYAATEPLVVYTGKLGKGIAELEYILDAAALLPGVNFLFTGGKAETLAYMKGLCSQRKLYNVQFSGFINDVSFVRVYQAAADVLVSYYSAKDHAVEYNLPQKMMEYMFSGNPVVTPDFPASRPFVNDQTACLVAPDNPAALADGIRKLLADPGLSSQLAQRAKESVQEMTFEKKAVGLLQSLKQ
jgi:glycosyltransferase involved in cell wall biosynthesis